MVAVMMLTANTRLPFPFIFLTQSLMESMKEVYGLFLFVAILCLVILMVRYSSFRLIRVIEPTYRFIYNFCKKEVFARLRVRRVKQ